MIRFRWKPKQFVGIPYDDYVDIGHGHRVRLTYDNGQPIFLNHVCPDLEGNDHVASFPVTMEDTHGQSEEWQVIQLYPLTIAPSIWIKEIRQHGHIRNGKWEVVPDHKFISKWYRNIFRPVLQPETPSKSELEEIFNSD